MKNSIGLLRHSTQAIKVILLAMMLLISNHTWSSSITALPNSPEEYVEILKNLGEDEAAAAMIVSIEHDHNNRSIENIALLSKLLEKFPESTYLMWRLSRNYWVYAENLDINDKESRLKYFNKGLEVAKRGIKSNKDCAECHLFKAANLGRIGTTKGLVSSVSVAKDLSKALEMAISLNPQHQDAPYNTSLGNAYYASATFYRIVPDLFIVKWIAGVRGDKDKALKHIKKAVELTPTRIDYQVELAVMYLCLAEKKDKKAMHALGIATLEKAISMKQNMVTDPIDKEYARGFLKDQSGVCGFSRDGIIDLDKKKLRQEAKEKNVID